jgi:hypothetical protein
MEGSGALEVEICGGGYISEILWLLVPHKID